MPARRLVEPRSRRGAPAPRRESVPGSTREGPYHQASAAHRGQGKTAGQDAFAVADQARMRQDLGHLRPGDETVADLRTLTAHRLDLVNDRTRQTTQFR
ncbi:IS110 family transposase [Streptomyces sp. NBC_00285]|uniref:IS110 family transposase n=1 Tax=Streptomyces sp. NBC_00285 TaxID=2975700 RepID=UPI003FA7294D